MSSMSKQIKVFLTKNVTVCTPFCYQGCLYICVDLILSRDTCTCLPHLIDMLMCHFSYPFEPVFDLVAPELPLLRSVNTRKRDFMVVMIREQYDTESPVVR